MVYGMFFMGRKFLSGLFRTPNKILKT